MHLFFEKSPLYTYFFSQKRVATVFPPPLLCWHSFHVWAARDFSFFINSWCPPHVESFFETSRSFFFSESGFLLHSVTQPSLCCFQKGFFPRFFFPFPLLGPPLRPRLFPLKHVFYCVGNFSMVSPTTCIALLALMPNLQSPLFFAIPTPPPPQTSTLRAF